MAIFDMGERTMTTPRRPAPDTLPVIEQSAPQQPAPTASGEDLDTLFEDAITRTNQDFDQALNRVAAGRAEEKDPLIRSLSASAGGAFKSGFETYDTIFGEPEFAAKTDFRKSIEINTEIMRRTGIAPALASGVAQFATGLLGVGKFAQAGKLLKVGRKASEAIKTSRALKVAAVEAQAAVASQVAFDPYEERLSNFLAQYPGVQQPVFEYLAAASGDSEAEARLKIALEGAGLTAALLPAMAAIAKGYRAIRTAGDAKEAERFFEEAARSLPPVEPTIDRPSLTVFEAAPLAREDREVAQAITGELPTRTPAEGSAREVVQAIEGAGQNAPGRPREALQDSKVPAESSSAAEAPRPPLDSAESPRAVEAAGEEGPSLFGKFAEDEAANVRVRGLTAEEARLAETRPPRMRLSEDQANAILQRARADQEARAAGRTAGEHEFPGELPWKRINGTDDAHTLMMRVAQVAEPQWQALRGGDVMSDARVEKVVDDLVALTGNDRAEIIGTIVRAGEEAPKLVGTAEAGAVLSKRIFKDLYALSQRVKAGDLSGFASELEAQSRMRKMMLTGMEVLGATRSIVTNNARTLRRQRFGINLEAYKSLQNLSADELMAAIDKTGGDLEKLAKTATPGFWQRAGQIFAHTYINNLLSWYPTHVRNALSGLSELAQRPAAPLIGSLVTDARHALGLSQMSGSELRKRMIYEWRYSASALLDGWDAAIDAFKTGTTRINPHSYSPIQLSLGTGEALKFAMPKDGADLFKQYMLAQGTPARALGAVDAFAKEVRYRAVVQAKAAADADKLGLKGDAFREYLKGTLNDAFDDAGAALDDVAWHEASTVTFTDPLPGFGRWVHQGVAHYPFLRIPVTFVQVPLKAFEYGTKLTPGLNLLMGSYREAISGARGEVERARAWGQMMMGTFAMAAAWQLAEAGVITGAGPVDPKARQFAMAQGFKPYSIVLRGEDGQITHVPYNWMLPLAMPLGLMADLQDMMAHPAAYGAEAMGRMDQLALAVAVSLWNQAKNQTFLIGLKDTIESLADPVHRGTRFAGDILGNLIPFSSAVRGVNANLFDPNMHEARTLVDQALKSMPGYSQGIPVRRDALGEPVVVHSGLWASEERTAVDEELLRMITVTGDGLTPPSPRREGGIDLRDHLIDDGSTTAYDRLQEYAAFPGKGRPPLREALLKIMNTFAYQTAPDGPNVTGTRLWMLSQQAERYREAAYKRLLRENPKLEQAVHQRRTEIKGATIVNRMNARQAMTQQPGSPQEAARTLQELGVQVPGLTPPLQQ